MFFDIINLVNMRVQFTFANRGLSWRKRVIDLSFEDIISSFRELPKNICFIIHTVEYDDTFSHMMRKLDILVKNLYTGQDFYLLYNGEPGNNLSELIVPFYYERLMSESVIAMTGTKIVEMGGVIESAARAPATQH